MFGDKKQENIPSILLAEDDQLLSSTLKSRLEAEGFSVVIAYDGEEVLRQIRENNFKLLLLDIILPLKNGFDILEAFKQDPQLQSPPPVMIISNLGQDENLRRAKELGAIKYFIKAQVSIEEIIRDVKDYVYS